MNCQISRWAPLLFLLALLVTPASWAQVTGEQLGAHDMSPGGTSLVKGGVSNACLYCHAPHGSAQSGGPLWNQQQSVQTYTGYNSSTFHQTSLQPALGSPSKLCLSCHDGTVAPGQTIAYGRLNMGGTMKSTSQFGADLRASHPFSLKTPLVDSPELNALLSSNPASTADPKVTLVAGTIECTTCHQPHFQFTDPVVPSFLVRENSGGKLCLACHDPNKAVSGQANYLSGWGTSVHATSASTTSNQPYVGAYTTVADNACNACHMPHNASSQARLLRGTDEQACITCHNGTNTTPAAPNVFTQLTRMASHPVATTNNAHDRTETAVLNNNRHATCADCHNAHAAKQVTTFTDAPNVRPSQASVIGVSATDGVTVVNPAVEQSQTCFRCHGTSAGKTTDATKYGYLPTRLVSAADRLNVIAELSSSATSSHPVTHNRTSALAQPSLRTNMLQLNGTTPGRAIGQRILCTDCHNSNDNREFGGAGANGPHGSTFAHILERRYEIGQVAAGAAPGTAITNLYPNPDLSSAGPFALCGKCHDMTQVLANTSFAEHSKHVSEKGFSCSVCHTAHGMAVTSSSVSGERMVNFDLNVVGQNGTAPISYQRGGSGGQGTCTLVCHNRQHN